MSKYYIIDNPPKDADGFNVVTDQEIAAFQAVIEMKAAIFMKKYCRMDPRSTKSHLSIRLMGWTYEDIQQELRIATWVALKSYKETLVDGKIFASKPTFVIKCMENRMHGLNRLINEGKRGFKFHHDYDSILLGGEFAEKEQAK